MRSEDSNLLVNYSKLHHVADTLQLGNVFTMSSSVGSAAVMLVKVSLTTLSALTDRDMTDMNASFKISQNIDAKKRTF